MPRNNYRDSGHRHPRWTTEEDDALRNKPPGMTVAALCAAIDRPYRTVMQRARRLGIALRDAQPHVMDTGLIAGPYRQPACRIGDWLDDERDGRLQVGGWTDALIPWPRRKKTGRHSPILCGDLVRAVRTESAAAVCHWWGISATTAWAWRKALGVDTTEGSQRIARRGVPPEAAAKGRMRAQEADSRAKIAEAKRGKPAHPSTRAALLRAATSPKPAGWGKRANQWMQDAKRSDK